MINKNDFILKVNKIDMFYGNIQALRSVDLEIKKGSVVAILGANGAGKSSLFKAIMGICPPVKGEIFYNGKNITKETTWRNPRNGLMLVPENRGLFRELTVYENLRLTPIRKGTGIKDCIDEAYEMFPVLRERRNQLTGTLSGGEQQMLVLARAFIARPELLLIDEMSMGLAPQIVSQLFQAVVKIKQKGTTVVVIEQYINEALKIADYVNIMRRGEIVLSVPISELKNIDEIQERYFGITVKKETNAEKPKVEILKESLTNWRKATSR